MKLQSTCMCIRQLNLVILYRTSHIGISLLVKFWLMIVEADTQKFTIGFLEGPFRIGMPFQVPLEFQDAFGHVTKPDPQVMPQLEAR